MKRIFPFLIVLISACSHSRQACDAYDVDASSGSGSSKANGATSSYRSVSAPDFSDTVTLKKESAPAIEQINQTTINAIALKSNAAVYRAENETRKVDAKQQFQTTAIANDLASLSATNAQQRTQRNPSAQDQLKMDKNVRLLEQLAPESFEYNLYAYISGNYDVSRISFLEKAAAMQPSNRDVLIQYSAYYVSMNDEVNASTYLDQWGRSLEKNQKDLIYAKDVLNSVEDHGILVLHGVNDSYSALYQQYKNKFRPDVVIVSLELLQSQQYRKTLVSKGVKLPESELIDPGYLEAFCALNAERIPSLAMTIPREYLNGISNRLYAVGLTFAYSDHSEFDNFYRNEMLWNTKLSKELIKELNHGENESGGQLISNYLPMLLQLRQVYVQKNETDRIQEIDRVLMEIGKATGKMETIEKIKEGQK